MSAALMRCLVALLLLVPARASAIPCLFVAVVGDSKTVGVGCCIPQGGYRTPLAKQLLYQSGVGAMFTNAYAVNGISVHDSKLGVDAWLATQGATPKPTLAIVNLGTNDLIGGLTASEAELEADLGYILDAIRAKWSGCSVLVVKPWIPAQVTKSALLATYIDDVVAARQPWASAGVDESAFLSGKLEPDAIHPNIAGYAATATAIQAAIGY